MAGGVPRGHHDSVDRRGYFVVLVGPDGVGKTTLAGEMARKWGGSTGYVHFRPPLLSALATRPSQGADPLRVKGVETGSVLVGVARILRSFLQFWAGYLLRIRPAVRRGWLVIGDRWGYGYLVQPTALRYYGPDSLASFLVTRLPKPDLVVALEAPLDMIRARKPELAEEAAAEEMRRYQRLPVARVIKLNTSSPVAEIADHVLRAVFRAEVT